MSRDSFYEKVSKLASKVSDHYIAGMQFARHDVRTYYRFNRDGLSNFWRLYCQHVLMAGPDETPSLYEMTSSPPIEFFFDIKMQVSSPMNLTDKVFRLLVNEATQFITSRVRIDEPKETISVVMTSDIIHPSNGERPKNYRVQLLLRFPFLHIDISQSGILTKRFGKYLQERRVKFNLDSSCNIVDFDNSLITDYHDRHPPMYGSMNDPFHRLKVVKVYDPNRKELSTNYFKPDDHPLIRSGGLVIPKTMKRDELIPLFMSLQYGNVGELKNITADVSSPTDLDVDEVRPKNKNYFLLMEDIDTKMKFPSKSQVADLLKCISQRRFGDKKNPAERYIIGQAIKNVYEDDPDWFKIWHSRLGSTSKSDAREGIDEFGDSRYTGRTLLYMARQDDIEGYYEWHLEQCRPLFDQCMDNITETDVAILFHRLFADMLFYNDITRVWHIFDQKENHLVEATEQRLYTLLNIKLIGAIDLYQTMLRNEIDQSPNMTTDERDLLNHRIANSNELIKKLKTTMFKTNIIKESRSLFCIDRAPNELFDTNPDILCVRSGVFVFQKKSIYFRKGLPEDYCTKSTRVPFDPSSATTHSREMVMNLLKKIYPNPDVLKFVMDYHAFILRGINREKIFLAMISKGNTGKSTVISLLEEMLGNYLQKYNYSDISEAGRRKGGPAPARATAYGCRLVIVQETGKETISKEVIKEETGNDSYQVRGLYQSGGVFRPLYWFAYASNHPPHWNDPDEAIRNRCVYVPHMSTFSLNPPPSVIDQERLRIYKADPDIQSRLKYYARTYLVMLYERYPEVCERGGLRSNIPVEIKNYTERYMSHDDTMGKFIGESLKYDANINDGMTTDEVYKLYVRWSRRNNQPFDNLQTFSLEFKCYIQSMTIKDDKTREIYHVEYDIPNDTWLGIVPRETTTSFQQQPRR